MCLVNQPEFKHHKPLEMIWKKGIATASPRLQRLLLRLARYEIQVEYICGNDNSIADVLSRDDPLSPKPMDSKQMDVIPVHHITSNVTATDNRLDRIRVATTADLALNQWKHYIFHGSPLQRQQLPERLQLLNNKNKTIFNLKYCKGFLILVMGKRNGNIILL